MSEIKVDRDGVWHVPVTHKDLLKVADSIARDLEACMAERDELRRRIIEANVALGDARWNIDDNGRVPMVHLERALEALDEERGDE